MKTQNSKLKTQNCGAAFLGQRVRQFCILLFTFCILMGPVGCARITWPRVEWKRLRWPRREKISKGFQIVAMSNRDVADLSADDIVLIMRQAGFSDGQIMELGPDVHDGLLLSGAVQVRRNKKVEAIFAVNSNYIFITTRLRGSFIYDLKKGNFGMNGVYSSSPRS
jgi:hypothetical protein